jgi:hypothetical protein
MSKSFTYIIRSNNKINKDDSTVKCLIKLNGLPQQFKYFECEVVLFNVYEKSQMIELRADSIGFENGVDTNNGFKTCAFTCTSNTNSQGKFRYIVENFNTRNVMFELYDQSNNLESNTDGSPFTHPWVLVLNMTGVEN